MQRSDSTLTGVMWGGKEHTFRLTLKQVRELEASRDSGLLQIFDRLTAGTWRVDDVSEPIRLGLIGGGMKTEEAKFLIEEHVTPGSLVEHSLIAKAIVGAVLLGVPEDPVGKNGAGEAASEARPDETDASSSPPSTAAAW